MSYCKTQDCKNSFKTFFNKNYKLDIEPVFREKKYLDANQIIEMKIWFEDSFVVKKSINYKDNFVNWTDTINHVGSYAMPEHNGTVDSTAKITADPTLDKHITPIDLFSNCNYGLIEIKSKRATIKLIKVVYE